MAGVQNYIPMVGVDKLAYAKVTSNTTSAYTAETPKMIPGLTEAGVNLNPQTSTFYADNGAYDTATAMGEFDIAVACADVPPAMKADLFGYGYDSTTGLGSVSDINAPSVAILYRMMKSNGAYRYIRIFSAKAVPNEEKAQTKGGSINFQTNGFSLKGAKRLKDGLYYEMLDDDDPSLPVGVTAALIAEKWFSSVSWEVAAGE